MATDVPKHTKKSVLDIWNAYHSVPIREEDKDKTTFIIETGRYRYLRAPQGFLASGDGFTHRESIIARNLQTLVKFSLTVSSQSRLSSTKVTLFLMSLYLPVSVMNVVLSLSSSLMGTEWYAFHMSSTDFFVCLGTSVAILKGDLVF